MVTRKTRAAQGTAPPKRRTRRKGPAPGAGLEPRQCVVRDQPPELHELMDRVAHEGGEVVGAYKEPQGGHPLVLAVLPIGSVEPTPFQRDLSDAHAKRLTEVISRTGRFLDPIVAVSAPGDGFWTPNGRHRLEAMRRLGARAITALVVPDRAIARQILALNTEKAHNLKERSLEVVRICRDLIASGDGASPESSFAFWLEDPALVTLGVCYEKHPRLAGGAYHPVLRRTERFSDEPLATALRVHDDLAGLVLDLDEKVTAAVSRLRERGLTSPYLRTFVVARVNPLRWTKGEPPPAQRVLEQMRDRAARFDAGRVNEQDLARVGGAAPDEEG